MNTPRFSVAAAAILSSLWEASCSRTAMLSDDGSDAGLGGFDDGTGGLRASGSRAGSSGGAGNRSCAGGVWCSATWLDSSCPGIGSCAGKVGRSEGACY